MIRLSRAGSWFADVVGSAEVTPELEDLPGRHKD